MKKFKYLGAYIVPLLGLFTFHSTGILAYFGLFFLYVMVPIIEYIFPPNSYNFESVEKDLANNDFFYDFFMFFNILTELFNATCLLEICKKN